MRWFRFYSEALDDPKVQRLSGDLFKAWVNLLCLANDGTPRGTLPSIEDIGFRLRLSPAKTRAIIDDLVSRGLIDADDETLQPHNWNDRQAKSDNVAERVQKHRAKQQEAVTRNVTYPPDVTTQKKTRVDTDIETEEEPPTARESVEVESTETERKIVVFVKRVPGMANVADADIVLHLRECNELRGPFPDEFVLTQMQKWSNHWSAERANAPQTQRFRQWRKAVTNWFEVMRRIYDDEQRKPHATSRNGRESGRYADAAAEQPVTSEYRPRVPRNAAV